MDLNNNMNVNFTFSFFISFRHDYLKFKITCHIAVMPNNSFRLRWLLELAFMKA